MPTRLGFYYVGAVLLTFVAASASGNNLLYLLSGLLAASFGLSFAWSRWNLAGLSAEVQLPDQVFEDQPFRLRLSATNPGRRPAHQIRLAWGGEEKAFDRLEPGECVSAVFVARPGFRGRVRLALRLESPFPLGLFRARVPFEAEALAWPALRDRRDLSRVETSVEGGVPLPRKGIGEELYGIRDYRETDDLRLMNWKLTAKTGRPLVNEYAQRSGQRVTLRVEGGEEEIREAASAAKFLIDSGAEVDLRTPTGATGFGKGLLHLERIFTALALLGDGAAPREVPAPPMSSAPAFKATPTTIALLYLTSALVYASLFQVEELPSRLLFWMAPLFFIGLALDRYPDWRIPAVAWTPVSAGMLIYGTMFGWRMFGVTISTTHILLYILAHRVLTEKGPRELSQAFTVVFLGFFLLSGLSVSLWYPLSLAGYLGLAGAWLLACQDEQARPGWVPALAALIAMCLPLAGGFFLAMPRFETRALGATLAGAGLDPLRIKESSVIGYSDTVSLGFFGELKKSSARAMRLRIEETERAGRPRYVRGAALELFDGVRWSKARRSFQYSQSGRPRRTESGRAWVPKTRGRFLFPGGEEGQAMERIEFTLYPSPIRVAFTVDGVRAMESADEAVYFDADDTIYFVNPALDGRRYAIRSVKNELGFSGSIVRYDELVRASYLSLPPLPPRVGELAERITAGRSKPLDKARAVEGYLRTHYDYSLFSSGPKTLETFLFDSKEGNCEYFATAAAVLLRRVGVPTRIVTGFLAVEFNELGRFYDVRQSDAHAWTEAYIEGRGWVTIDATPAGGFFPASLSSFRRRLDKLVDAWRLRWYRDVVGFDSYGQKDFVQKVGEALGAVGAATLALLIGAAALASLLPLARRFRPSAARVRSSGDFYRRMLAALEKEGFERAEWQTGREFADWVGRVQPGLAEPVGRITTFHYRARYAAQEPTDDDRREIDALIAHL